MNWNALSVQDEQTVKAWKAKVERLNTLVERAIQEAQAALAEFRETAVGNVFNKVVEYSGEVIKGMVQILAGMNKILETVNNLITAVKQKLNDLLTNTADKLRQTVTG